MQSCTAGARPQHQSQTKGSRDRGIGLRVDFWRARGFEGGLMLVGSCRRRLGLRLLSAAVALAVVLVVAAPAGAATTIGETVTNPNACTSDAVRVWWQHTTGSGSPSYAVPAGGGVITSWTTNPGDNAGSSTRLEVVREQGTTYTVVGESDVQTNIPTQNTGQFP